MLIYQLGRSMIASDSIPCERRSKLIPCKEFVNDYFGLIRTPEVVGYCVFGSGILLMSSLVTRKEVPVLGTAVKMLLW